MTLRDVVRADIESRLARSRLGSMLNWQMAGTDPDDLTGIIDDAFRLAVDSDPDSENGVGVAANQAVLAGQVALWRAVREGLILAYDFTADKESYKRSQTVKQVETILKEAENHARSGGLDMGDSPPATIDAVAYQTPYTHDRSLIYAERFLKRNKSGGHS